MAIDQATQVLVGALETALEHNIPPEELSPEKRKDTIQEFIEFYGKLVDFMKSQQPTPAKAAALTFFVSRLGLDKATGTSAKVMVTLVMAMSLIQDEFQEAVRKVREAQKEPQ